MVEHYRGHIVYKKYDLTEIRIFIELNSMNVYKKKRPLSIYIL